MDTGGTGIILKQIREGRQGSVSGFTIVKEEIPRPETKCCYLHEIREMSMKKLDDR
jgi:hypothetical protein